MSEPLHSSSVTPHDPFALRQDETSQLGFHFDEPRPTRRIWPVRALVAQVRELVERQFGDIWVEGEISNYRPAPSGHVYFTLKDAEAQLPIVLFRRQAMLLRFRPEDGLHVLVRGQRQRLRAARPVAVRRGNHGARRRRLSAACLRATERTAQGRGSVRQRTQEAAAHVPAHRGHHHFSHGRRHSRFSEYRQPPPLRPECAAVSGFRAGRIRAC